MSKRMKIIGALLTSATLMLSAVPALAEQTQSMDVTYFDEFPTNEYEVVIPASMSLNDQTKISISINEILPLSDGFSVHVDIDESCFGGESGKNINLYSESGGVAAFNVFRESDSEFLRKRTADLPSDNLAAAIFYGNHELNVGGELEFIFDSENSSLSRRREEYSGSIIFNIYGLYE